MEIQTSKVLLTTLSPNVSFLGGEIIPSYAK